jgi:protein-disulfide isomerase
MRLLPLLFCVACVAPKATPTPEPVSPIAATAKTFTVTEADLAAYIQKRPKLAREYYDLRRGALEEMVLDRLMDEAAKKLGVSGDTWLANEIEKRITPPSESELKAFFTSRVEPREPGADFAAEKPRIKEYLLEERRHEALRKVVADLREGADVKLKLPPARVAVAASGPSKGPATAPLTLVEFSDYQCPYCQREEQAIKDLLKAYPTQVRLVVRDFPLEMHAYARPAARAAICADQQGHFWEMHDRLFADPTALDDDGIARSAKELGLDAAKFGKCMNARETERKVVESQQAGEEAGVDGTPALFLNGRPFAGAVSFSDLKTVVEEELSAVAAASAAQPAGSP